MTNAAPREWRITALYDTKREARFPATIATYSSSSFTVGAVGDGDLSLILM
jgi:hypothetical protein